MNHILLAGDARKSDHVGMPDTIKASSYIDVHCNYFRFFLDCINQGLSENEVIPCYTPQMIIMELGKCSEMVICQGLFYS